jgi:hypothetical protein
LLGSLSFILDFIKKQYAATGVNIQAAYTLSRVDVSANSDFNIRFLHAIAIDIALYRTKMPFILLI